MTSLLSSTQSLMRENRRVIFILLLCLFDVTFAWHNIEHAIIARIAEKYANKLSMEKVRTISEVVGTKYNSTASYLDSACWADEIKKEAAYEYTDEWHFIRTKYSNDTTLGIDDTRKENVITKINSLMNNITEDDISDTASMNLRYFIHIMGDIHQPLHNIHYFDKNFPQDGQMFNIFVPENGVSTKRSLHYYTDAAGGLCSDTLELPFTDQRFDEINSKADEFDEDCPNISAYGFKIETEIWSKESYNAAIEIYNIVKLNDILINDQIEKIQMILRKQICLAGKRLGLSYNLLYHTFPIPSDFIFIMIGFLVLLFIVIIDEIYHGGSCSKRRKEYLGIDNNKKIVKFDFGNSKV